MAALEARFGMFRATASATVDHVVLDGNRAGRGGTAAYAACADLSDNSYGFNATFECAGCALLESASIHALCGTGFLVSGPATGVTIRGNTIAWNGVHDVANLWSDGLTVHDASDSVFTDNVFADNTDVDMIFGGCQRCLIQRNVIAHSGDPAGESFAALMIHKWPGTSGCYEDVDVSGNAVDCGPLRGCGSGLYIGSESWYPETPYGTLVEGTTSGLITGNTVVNALNAVYVAAQGLAIYGNGFLNAHGVEVPNSCGRHMTSATPILISPTTRSCHFNFENVDPEMSIHYSVDSWAGCVPNWPF
jgi:hypothetical protein